MRDNFVRASFHKSVLNSAHKDNNTLVIDELGLKNGGCRADIAVLNGKMIGYEIKTDRDTLIRLKNQMSAYNEVFDQIFIITGSRYLNKIVETIPEWWGVYLIIEIWEKNYTFKAIRKAKPNKQKVWVGIAQLLWKEELLKILSTTFKVTPKSNKTRQALYNMLEERCTADELGKIAINYLKDREGWRTNQKALSPSIN